MVVSQHKTCTKPMFRHWLGKNIVVPACHVSVPFPGVLITKTPTKKQTHTHPHMLVYLATAAGLLWFALHHLLCVFSYCRWPGSQVHGKSFCRRHRKQSHTQSTSLHCWTSPEWRPNHRKAEDSTPHLRRGDTHTHTLFHESLFKSNDVFFINENMLKCCLVWFDGCFFMCACVLVLFSQLAWE